ncbi:MAG: M13 family metallopeptidase [Bacteroidales bacterium]|nr:M13 family metallopeptidase [Bacteroidales bacterium]
MKKRKVYAMMILSTLAAGCAQKPAETPEPKKEVVPAIELSNMDTCINPADDFFRYANNNWLKNNPIPEEYSTYGAFTEIDEHNEILIQDIINEVSKDTSATQGSVAQKIRDFYNAGMDTVAINERGYSELLPYFEMVDALNDKADLAELLGQMHSNGVGGFFYAGGSTDPKNADMVIMHLYQGGLSLTDRDDYLVDETQEMRDKYVEHVAKMFELTGTDSIEAAKKAQNILAMETLLAKNSLSRVERRDPDRTYNKRSRQELQASTPNFNWDKYFDAAGAPTFDSLNVGMPDFIAAVDKVILNTDLNTIKDYLKWKIITSSASMLSSDLDEENFRFYGNYLYGQEAQQPRWRRILSATSGCLGEAVGQLYVEKHFPAEAKERMLNLVGNLRTALGERIKNLDWMSDETKAKALHKLDCFNVKIGYPDKWKDYSKYEVTPESYFENVHRAIRFENEIDMAKIGKPVDKDEWFMTPQTVNAYYSPEMNEIVFPAAILQPPFFNMDADDAVNYGGIGVVIGHEMTHGFDDQGCKYDEKGNLNNWWTEEDATKFNERTAQLVKLFNEFQVRGYQINGELTLGENIADLGGLNIAWDAYQMTDEAKANQSIDGFTPAQRFFISYGTIWRNNSRDKYIERQVKTDVHSPAEARVNRTLGSMPHFYEAFEILPENKMYIAPEERAAIW